MGVMPSKAHHTHVEAGYVEIGTKVELDSDFMIADAVSLTAHINVMVLKRIQYDEVLGAGMHGDSGRGSGR